MKRWDRAVAGSRKEQLVQLSERLMPEDVDVGEAGGKFGNTKQGQVNDAEGIRG